MSKMEINFGWDLLPQIGNKVKFKTPQIAGGTDAGTCYNEFRELILATIVKNGIEYDLVLDFHYKNYGKLRLDEIDPETGLAVSK